MCLKTFARGQMILHAAGSFAVVQIPQLGECGNDQTYGVLTFAKPIRDRYGERHIKDGLSKLNATAEWVRPLNRRLQRLFLWGDVAANKEATEQAHQDLGQQIVERAEFQEALDNCVQETHKAGHTSVFAQHPLAPLPCFVIDELHMRQDQKLVWIRQDLGDEATLEDFARKFLEIFGDKVVSVPQQKKTVLELYSKYAPSGSEKPWSK